MASVLRVTRRPIVVALVVLAAVAIVLVLVAVWNPWRYTALYPLAYQGGAVAVLVLAGALVAAAGLMRFADTGRKAVFGLVGALVAIPALCVGLPTVALGRAFRVAESDGPTVLAVSPDGNYSVVTSTIDTGTGVRTRLYLRSRNLLFSRESAVPLAECGYDPFAGGVPPESVRFTSDHTVAIPVQDAETTVIGFDPGTLTPAHTVAMCPPKSP
jgi:hypothetical protein